VQTLSNDDRQLISQTFHCTPAVLQVIIANLRLIAVAMGHTAYPTGDGQQTTLLLSGIAHEIAYGRGGGQIVLQSLGAGEIYGAMLSADDARDQQEVIAITALRGAQFADANLLRLMENYATVAIAISRQLAMQLQSLRQRMTETVLLSAVGRICAELSRRAEASPDSMVRPLPVFTEFALMAQTTRETVSRTMSQLEKRGIILRLSNGLQVIAPHRLAEMIN
jgi:CRP-like cAMP-binding protein